MRLFFALPCPAEVSDTIHNHLSGVRSGVAGVRWVSKDNYHLTLVFLGEVTTRVFDALHASFSEHPCSTRAFDIALKGVGFFPPRGRSVKVVYAPVVAGARETKAVHAEILGRCREMVPDLSSRFSPHLTLGRGRADRRSDLRSDRDPGVEADLRGTIEGLLSGLRVRYRCDSVVLYESELDRSGPRYLERMRIPLEPPV